MVWSVLLVVLTNVALPCDGRRTHFKDRSDTAVQARRIEKSGGLASVFLALSGAAGRSRDYRLGRTVGRYPRRLSTPRQQYRGPPDSWMNQGKMQSGTAIDRKTMEVKDMQGVVTPTARVARQETEATASVEPAHEAPQQEFALETYAPEEYDEEIEAQTRTSGRATREAEQAWAIAAVQILREENAARQAEEEETWDDQRVEEKNLPELLIKDISAATTVDTPDEEETWDDQRAKEKSLPELLVKDASIVDTRAARLYLPILGVAGLAASSYLYEKEPELFAELTKTPIKEEQPPPAKDVKPPPIKEVQPPPVTEVLQSPAKDAQPPPVTEVLQSPAKDAQPPLVTEVLQSPVKDVQPPPVAEVKPPPVTEVLPSSTPRDLREVEAALKRLFPGALDSATMDSKVADVLLKRGYTNANTLFASSMCPDEVNAESGDLTELMKSRWGESFGLGGLAGLPFVGKSGFTAYAHHVPDNGKLLVLFAPHVGINFDGKVGKLQRLNQKGLSTACGAAIGAYNGIMKDALAKKKDNNGPVATAVKTRNGFDGQIEYIKAKLQPRLQGIEAAPDEIAFVTYQMYTIVREFLIDQVLTASDVWKGVGEISIVGGIMVNLGEGGDRFVPLLFQAKEGEKSDVVDLYKDAFGNKPDLSYVLGGKEKAASFYNYDLNTLSMSAEDKLYKFFPGALDSESVDSKVGKTLAKYGYTRENTLLATSTCPDEVNSKQGELLELFKSRWGENFALGGLAGLPFVGKAGFGAYAHHVPDNGKLLIVFAPHVGIDFNGKVGALKRLSQKGVSTACGAAIGAYNGIIKEALDKNPIKTDAANTPFKSSDAFDTQIEYIKTKLRARMDGIDNAPDPIAFVTYQMYAIVREFVDEVLTASDLKVASEVCLLGGIQVNGETGDHFMPLLFESKRAEDANINDLFAETFGYRQDLSYVLGDKAKAKSFYKNDLRALS